MNLDDENDLIRQTIPFANEEPKKSWMLFLSTFFLTLTFFLIVIFSKVVALQIILGVFTGLCFGRLFVIYHDYNHKAILVKSKLARVLMKGFGLFALAPMSIWNHVHNHHHDHNSQFIEIVLGSFPILEKKQFEALSKCGQRKYLLIRHPLTIALSYLSVFIVSFCLYPFFENPKKHWDGMLSFIIHVLLSITIFYFIGFSGWLLGFVLPFSLMGLLGGYIFYAQHNFPGVKLMDQKEWSYIDAALHSSSFIKMNRFWRWVTANVGYHHVHHVNSRIPFYRLPEAMDCIPALQHPTITTLSLPSVRDCLSLKLWDSDRQEMIGLQ